MSEERAQTEARMEYMMCCIEDQLALQSDSLWLSQLLILY
jgi:hypothetical protein